MYYLRLGMNRAILPQHRYPHRILQELAFYPLFSFRLVFLKFSEMIDHKGEDDVSGDDDVPLVGLRVWRDDPACPSTLSFVE